MSIENDIQELASAVRVLCDHLVDTNRLLAERAGTVAAPAAGPEPEPEKAEEKPAPKKRARKAKPKPEPKPEPESPAVDLDTVRVALCALQKAKGSQAVWGLLGEYGVKGLSALPEADYASVIEKAHDAAAQKAAA